MLGALGVLAVGCNGTGGTGIDVWGPNDTGPDYPPQPPDTTIEDFPPEGSQKGPMPSFPRAHQADAPPPISGGTLLVTADGDHVVAADPDRDRIYVVSLATHSLLETLALRAHDEPGRVAEDDAHRVHVALRRGGADRDRRSGRRNDPGASRRVPVATRHRVRSAAERG